MHGSYKIGKYTSSMDVMGSISPGFRKTTAWFQVYLGVWTGGRLNPTNFINLCKTLHPGNIKDGNPKMEVDGKSFSFAVG